VTTPPAGWYDDPESPTHHRFWDGANWTDHRSHKNADPPIEAAVSSSAWNIFPATFDAIGSTWRQLLIVSIPNLVMGAAALILVYTTNEALFDSDVATLLDRVGDGPRPVDDGGDVDDLDPPFPASVVWISIVVVTVWFIIGTLVSTTLQRLLAVSMQGNSADRHDALVEAWRRVARVLGWSLVTVTTGGGVIALARFSVTGVLACLTAILVATPYAMAAYPAIAIAPRGRSPIAQARELLTGQVLAVTRRCLVYLVLWFVTLFTGLLVVQFVAGDIRLTAIGLTLTILMQNVVLSAGLVALWVDSGGPLDPVLTPGPAERPT